MKQQFKTYSVMGLPQYRLCEIMPTICGINGVNLAESRYLEQMPQTQCTCKYKIKNNLPSVSSQLLKQNRIRSYSQVIPKPKQPQMSNKLNKSVIRVQTPPKYLQLRVTARRWCTFTKKQTLIKELACNENEKCEAGGLTKLMSIYIAFSMFTNEQITSIKCIVPYFAEQFPKAELNAQNCLTINQLLYSILFRSGNDAVWTLVMGIGQYLGLTNKREIVNRFLQLMNETATKLQMSNTRYTNVDGVEDPNNVTTAYDIGLLMSKLIEYDLFRKIITTKTFKCQAQSEGGYGSTTYSWKNYSSRLMNNGMRGGFRSKSESAGICVSCVNGVGGNYKIIVMLRCNPKCEYKDAEQILKYLN